MEMLIALAAEDASVRISRGVRETLKKSYSSLFANVFYNVFVLDDRKKSDIKRVQNMKASDIPIVVTVETADHDKVTFVVAVSTLEPLMGNVNPTIAYITYKGKTDEYEIEPRLIKVRGIEYAIASTVARRASAYIDFGDNK
jgi:hypothetical protein